MKLKKNSSTFNLGDTSFRRKKLLDDYLELLKVLNYIKKDTTEWDSTVQKQFIMMVLNETELITTQKSSDNSSSIGDFKKRARTMTNALYKLGLCDKDRNLTKVGFEFIKLEENEEYLKKDLIEKNLNLSAKNILFLRQMLKLRIFNTSEDKSFNPFLIGMLLILKYEYIEENHFKQIIHNLYFDQNYRDIIENYQQVINGEITFKNYLDNNLLNKNREDEAEDTLVEAFINKGLNFEDVFKNRKTTESVKKYKKYYEALTKVRSDIQNDKFDEKNIKTFLDIARDSKIKSAFRSNHFFKIPNRSSKEVINFYNNNKDNPIFHMDDISFRVKLYEDFIIIKNKNLIYEYFDLTIRTFNLTGILDFSNGRVKISKRYLVDLLKSRGDELYNLLDNDYKDLDDYYKDFHNNKLTTLETLGFNELELNNYNKKLMKMADIDNFEEFNRYYINLEEEKFLDFIDENFPNEKLIKILKNIKNREDNLVYEQVTDNANIPTIFEYIMGIAWYKISYKSRKYNVLESLNLSLDGSFLPLSHAVGGDGDIIIDYDDHVLMLEVTLMDLSNQRRNELEPVIRHSTNLTIKEKDRPVYTIFIANETDYNVSNIFRLCSFINLKSTKGLEEYTSNGIQICSIEIDEIIKFLEADISYEKIYINIRNEFSEDAVNLIDYNWRKEFVEKIFKE